MRIISFRALRCTAFIIQQGHVKCREIFVRLADDGISWYNAADPRVETVSLVCSDCRNVTWGDGEGIRER